MKNSRHRAVGKGRETSGEPQEQCRVAGRPIEAKMTGLHAAQRPGAMHPGRRSRSRVSWSVIRPKLSRRSLDPG